jgi:hypothetical protein
MEVLMMAKSDKQNKKQGRSASNKKSGYGDKKLEGPNQPST